MKKLNTVHKRCPLGCSTLFSSVSLPFLKIFQFLREPLSPIGFYGIDCTGEKNDSKTIR